MAPRAEATPASVQGGTGRHTDTRTRVPDRRALLGTPRAEGAPRGRVAPASAVWAHRPQRTPARASPHASVWARGPLCGAAAPSCGHGRRGRRPAWPQALEGTAHLQARQPWGQPTGDWPGAAVHPWRGPGAARGAGAARTAPHPGCARHLRVESRVPSRARPSPPGPRRDLRVQPGAGTPAWLPCSGRASEWGAPFAGVSASPVFLIGLWGAQSEGGGPGLFPLGWGRHTGTAVSTRTAGDPGPRGGSACPPRPLPCGPHRTTVAASPRLLGGHGSARISCPEHTPLSPSPATGLQAPPGVTPLTGQRLWAGGRKGRAAGAGLGASRDPARPVAPTEGRGPHRPLAPGRARVLLRSTRPDP